MKKKIIKVIYKNYRGEISERNILPLSIWFGNNEFHIDNQWLLNVKDCDRNIERTFALKDIQWL